MIFTKPLLVATTLVSLGSSCFAHSKGSEHQHFNGWQALFHLLTEPDHLAMLAAAVGLSIFIWRKVKKS